LENCNGQRIGIRCLVAQRPTLRVPVRLLSLMHSLAIHQSFVEFANPPFKLHVRPLLDSKLTHFVVFPNFQIIVCWSIPVAHLVHAMANLKKFGSFVAALTSSFLVLNKLLCSPHINDGILTNIGCRLCRVNLGSSSFSNDYNSYTD